MEIATERRQRPGAEALKRQAVHRPAQPFLEELAQIAAGGASRAGATGLVVDLLELVLDARTSSRRACRRPRLWGCVTTLERARTKNLPRRAR